MSPTLEDKKGVVVPGRWGRGEELRVHTMGCGKKFEKPTVLTDSQLSSISYYACPHCMSRLDITVVGEKIRISRQPSTHGFFESPAKLRSFLWWVEPASPDTMLPDECLICPKYSQCNLRNSWGEKHLDGFVVKAEILRGSSFLQIVFNLYLGMTNKYPLCWCRGLCGTLRLAKLKRQKS